LINVLKDWQKCCIMAGANVDFTTNGSSSCTALYHACLDEQESLVKLLLQYRANPNQSVFTRNNYVSNFVYRFFYMVLFLLYSAISILLFYSLDYCNVNLDFVELHSLTVDYDMSVFLFQFHALIGD